MRIAVVTFLISISTVCAQEQASLSGVLSDTSSTTIWKLPVNSQEADFGVTAYNNDFVFASSRNNRMMIRYFNSDGSNPLALYSFHRQDSTGWSDVSAFNPEFVQKANEGPVAFSSNGATMILTANNRAASDNEKFRLALFESHLINGKWSDLALLPFCTAADNFMQPCFADHDSVLYFVSDYPGGAGGKDIWYVKKSGNQWSPPVNAGDKINSVYDELFPFCSSQGVLYFSSNRPQGNGGLDLYAISLKAEDTRVEHFGGWLNSSQDDFGIWLNGNQNEGFFSSNREGDDNIYGIDIHWPSVSRMDTIVKPQLCYTFFEEATLETQDTVKTAYLWSFGDGEQLRGYTVRKCFDSVGVYGVHLSIRDSSGGDMILSSVDYEFDIANPNYTEFVSPDTISVGQSFAIDAGQSAVEGFIIENVYYDFGNGFRSKGLRAEHVYRKRGTYYPQIYLSLRNKTTGAHEDRCVVKPIVVN